MIEVGVGDENRLDRPDPKLLDRVEEPVGLVAGIDDQRRARALLAHDEAVLLHRPDREHARVDHLPPALFVPDVPAAFRRCRRRYNTNSK